MLTLLIEGVVVELGKLLRNTCEVCHDDELLQRGCSDRCDQVKYYCRKEKIFTVQLLRWIWRGPVLMVGGFDLLGNLGVW